MGKLIQKTVEKTLVEKPEEKEESEEQEEEEPEEEPEQEVEEVVEEKDEVENKYIKRERQWRKAEIEKRKRKKDPKRFRKNKFTIIYKQNKKRFKTIEIGENKVITLKEVKTILEPAKKNREKIIKQTEEAKLVLGGKCFDENKYKWAPVPFSPQIMTIDRTKKEAPLENVSIDRLNMPAENKRRQDWNAVNNLSLESKVNILNKKIWGLGIGPNPHFW